MYVKRVELHNVKCFSDFTLEFPDPPPGERSGGWYVIVGPNGTGKSTILRAIALAFLGPRWGSALAVDTRGWTREETGFLSVSYFGGEVLPEAGRIYPCIYMPIDADGLQMVPDTPERVWVESAAVGGRVVVAGYGAFRREGGRTTASQRPPWAGRFDSLFEDDFALDATRWLIEAESRGRMNSGEGVHPYRQLVAEVPSFVQPVIPPGFAMLALSPEGVRFRDLLGNEVGLSDVGDGYRSIVGLVLRLLRDLLGWRAGDEESGAFGSLGAAGASVDDAAKTPGVVLIDEPDAHLHPSWQREIGFALQRVFPNIQFIVATHSPFICQAASPGGIFQLRMNEAEKRIEAVQPVESTVQGWHIQDIYRDALGLDNWLDMATSDLLEQHRELAAKREREGLSPEEAGTLDELATRLHDVLTAPGQTPEAREEYRRLRKLRERLEAKVGGGGC